MAADQLDAAAEKRHCKAYEHSKYHKLSRPERLCLLCLFFFTRPERHAGSSGLSFFPYGLRQIRRISAARTELRPVIYCPSAESAIHHITPKIYNMILLYIFRHKKSTFRYKKACVILTNSERFINFSYLLLTVAYCIWYNVHNNMQPVQLSVYCDATAAIPVKGGCYFGKSGISENHKLYL